MSLFDVSKQFRRFRRYAWSNKFEAGSSVLVDSKKNTKLRSLLELNSLVYGTKSKPFVRLLKRESYGKYQSELLRTYLRDPEQHLKLDCDRLVLTMKCTSSDLSKIKKRVLKPSFSSLGQLLHIKKVPVGKVNQITEKEAKTPKNRPMYKYAYNITIAGDRRRFFKLYLTDDDTTPTTFINSNNEKTELERLFGLRIDFIPDRFNEFELSAIFGHLKSVIDVRRYSQLIKNARVTRIDIGFNMVGVLSSFACPLSRDGRISDSSCLPDGKDDIKETTYIGQRHKSSHFIIYEKLLKELKDDLKSGLTKEQINERLELLAVTTRVERRHYPYRSKNKGKDFNTLPDLRLPLTELAFIDPILFQYVEDDYLAKFLRDKTTMSVNKLKGIIDRKTKGKSLKKQLFKLDKAWFESASHEMLSHYHKLIVNAEKPNKDEVEGYCAEGLHLPEILPVSITNESVTLLDASKPQWQAIKSNKPKIALVAGAGSGKTRTIVERVKYLIEEKRVCKSDIKVLTYTTDAAKEISQRIRGTGELFIGTFHSWCFSLLKDYDSSTYADITVIEGGKKRDKLLQQAVEGCNLKFKQLKEFIDFKVSSTLGFRQVIDSNKYEIDCELKDLQACYRKFNSLKSDDNVIDFNDMVWRTYKKLQTDKDFLKYVASRSKYLIVDEVQDSNPLQWKLFRKLIKNGSEFFCVGDPAQSIFGFRGGSPKNLIRFDKFVTGGYIFTLPYSFRLSPPILFLSNWVRTQISGDLQSLAPVKKGDDLPMLVEHKTLDEVLPWLVSDIQIKLKNDYKLSSIKIFVRTNVIKDRIVKSLTQVLKINKKIRAPDIKNMVMTMHSAKGLECQVGYVIDPRFWNSKLDTRDDHLRLIYVALTRASTELIICKSLSGKRIYSDAPTKDYILDELCNQEGLFKIAINDISNP
ncbi:UvrD-helicase domain-containing protein [Pseudoalteromonas sp. APC 3218]|uniref:UvrD-helicase domain-containing protein n=1 Tax=Pseudoalteromonas sp. APC 3218 TaxID=3035180 RepID=UPI0025B2F966|nr:UvrD-helicase domain-containing protein [Pseudoalteromonas sp. APC 3218]MDN3404204.1 UvrD-helicase domain-containing protein [Pseudoalteromonas sp. APC 3218]